MQVIFEDKSQKGFSSVLLLVLLALLIFASLGAYFLFANTQQKQSSTTSASSPVSAAQNVVTLTSSGFSPAVLTIQAGQTVIWINKSGQPATVNSNPHPVHTDYPPLNLGSFASGATLTLAFPKAGTYGYHNHLNPNETATIVVK